MPKTLFINAVSCKTGGGVNDLAHTLPLLERRLRDDGWTTRTWTVRQGWEALEDVGYPMRTVNRVDVSAPIRRAAWEFVGFPRLVRKQRPDVVFQFSNFIFRGLPAPQLTVLRSLTFFSDQYATTPRTGLYQKLRYRAGCWFSKKTVQRAAEVFCISETHRQEIIRTLGKMAERVRTSHLGFACPAEAQAMRGMDRQTILRNCPAHARDLLRPLGEPDRRIVLNVAHYYEHKNLGDLLEAVETLAQRQPGLALILTAGLTHYQGPQNERTQRDTRLAKRLAEKGLLFDLGPVPKELVWKLLALADLFAFPSSLESFGHPLLEAMSMGVPVIAADTAIHREITDGAALLHPLGESRKMAASIERILGDTCKRAKLIEAGLARQADFSWEKHADTLRDCVRRATANK